MGKVIALGEKVLSEENKSLSGCELLHICPTPFGTKLVRSGISHFG